MTIESLAKNFDSAAWASLKQSDSKLVKMLLHSAFKDENEGQSAEQIDFNYMMIYGFLHCSGKPKDKVEVLFNILQEGGREAHKFISAEDADFTPTFQKLCRFATLDLFDIAQDTINLECPWNDQREALEKVITDEDDEGLEGMWLDAVYGVKSKLDYEEWAKITCDKGKSIFDPNMIRKNVFEKAGLTYSLK